MRAIRFHYRPANYLLTRFSGRYAGRIALSPLGSVRLDDVSEPPLPGSDWVRVRTSLSGICGSDLSVFTAHDSFTLEPFGAYPFTFGHENVGTIAERGARVDPAWRPGDRVIVNPMLACRQRAIDPPCPACARGDYGLCLNTDRGTPGPGAMIGYCPGTGGGWAESFLAHQSQLHRADGLEDDVAVLTDPFATSLRAVLLHPPRAGDNVLVIGAGTIGLLAVAALRATGWDGELAVLGRYPFQLEVAMAAGASRVFASARKTFDWAAGLPQARTYRPRLAPAFVEGGPDLIYDTVGSARSLRDAVRLARAGGRIVLVGGAAKVGLDLTRVWYRQLTLAGIFVYGPAPFEGAERDIYESAIELLRRGDLGALGLVTHTYPLSDYHSALAVALDKRGAGSLKVALRPD